MTKTPNPDRSAACKRAWDTIRRNRALKAAGHPVPEARTPKAPGKDYSALIADWLIAPPPAEPVVAKSATTRRKASASGGRKRSKIAA